MKAKITTYKTLSISVTAAIDTAIKNTIRDINMLMSAFMYCFDS